MKLKTKNLIIRPLSVFQMQLLSENRNKIISELQLNNTEFLLDEHLQSAYKKMYENCLAHKKNIYGIQTGRLF